MTQARKKLDHVRDQAVAFIEEIAQEVLATRPRILACTSTFQQHYPAAKISVGFCIDSRDDPAYATLVRLLADFPQFDARIYVELEDPWLHGADGHVHNLGPNPKIRNMSRAYREAKGDVVWIIDCNVWVS